MGQNGLPLQSQPVSPNYLASIGGYFTADVIRIASEYPSVQIWRIVEGGCINSIADQLFAHSLI
jgi:hypothetical protein